MGSTFSTTFQVAIASEFPCHLKMFIPFSGLWFHNDLNIRSPIVLEFKCDDLCGFLTMGESRYFEYQDMKLIFNPSSYSVVLPQWSMLASCVIHELFMYFRLCFVYLYLIHNCLSWMSEYTKEVLPKFSILESVLL